MNLDQLIKLAKLANNNPNEHEANAAARKVCRIIEAGNYNFTGAQTPPVGSTGKNWNYQQHRPSPFEDIFTWARQQAAKESKERREEEEKKRTQEAKQKEPTTERGFYGRKDWDIPFGSPPPPMNWTWSGEDPESKKRYKKDYIQKNRDCAVCNTTKLTFDTTTPYVCDNCQWRKWNDERSKA